MKFKPIPSTNSFQFSCDCICEHQKPEFTFRQAFQPTWYQSPIEHLENAKKTFCGIGNILTGALDKTRVRHKLPYLCRWTLSRVNVLGCWLLHGSCLCIIFFLSRVVRGSGNYHWRDLKVPRVIPLSCVRSYKRKLVLLVTSILYFMVTAQILARLLANFYRQ